MGKADDEIQPKAQKIEQVDGTGGVKPSAIKEYYEDTERGYPVSYQQVADHFNVRLYDVRKILDPDFRPDPDVEAGVKAAD